MNEESQHQGEFSAPSGSGRERSTIEFPYGDLDDAMDVAKTVHKRGGDSCTQDQLAAWMKHESVKSGSFRLKVATARTFGLVEVEKQTISLTPLGHDAVDPGKERAAKSDAFLTVPLYRRIFETYRGRLLPPDSGLESMMGSFGVATKQTPRARQSFQRSAEQAGLFDLGRDRLVMPAGTQATAELSTLPSAPPVQPLSSLRDAHLHPFVQGLLDELPEPGAVWPDEKRSAWLDTAASIFKLIYESA